jgi:L-lactate utilization protein LutB
MHVSGLRHESKTGACIISCNSLRQSGNDTCHLLYHYTTSTFSHVFLLGAVIRTSSDYCSVSCRTDRDVVCVCQDVSTVLLQSDTVVFRSSSRVEVFEHSVTRRRYWQVWYKQTHHLGKWKVHDYARDNFVKGLEIFKCEFGRPERRWSSQFWVAVLAYVVLMLDQARRG